MRARRRIAALTAVLLTAVLLTGIPAAAEVRVLYDEESGIALQELLR